MKIEKNKMIVGGIIAIIAAGIYLLFYSPLMKELRKDYSEYRAINSELIKAQDYIESVKEVKVKSAILTGKDFSFVIDELTKKGKSEDIDFISMTPREAERKKGQRYDVLPIEMEIKSDYAQIVAFLGSLDQLESSLITVREFTMKPDEKNPNTCMTKLIVNMHLLGYKYAK
jgi:Tfp pilus assembly protein PilO